EPLPKRGTVPGFRDCIARGSERPDAKIQRPPRGTSRPELCVVGSVGPRTMAAHVQRDGTFQTTLLCLGLTERRALHTRGIRLGIPQACQGCATSQPANSPLR